MGGWQDSGGDTAAWQAPGRDEPAARDSRAWAEDPLTSPSFSQPSSYSTDSRSYRGSHTRDRGRLDEPANGSDSSSYGHGHDSQAAPAWEDSYGSSQDDGWRGPGHEYSSGRLDPLAASRLARWPSRTAAGTPHRRPRAAARPTGSRRMSRGNAAKRVTTMPPGMILTPSPAGGAGRTATRAPAMTRPAMTPIMAGIPRRPGITATPVTTRPDTARPRAATGSRITVMAAPATASRATARAKPVTGCRSTARRTTGYDLPDYGRGYQRPGHGTPDADYGLPAYGSGGSRGGFGQGPGYGRYPGYDAGRR